jgi:hypothetical protein
MRDLVGHAAQLDVGHVTPAITQWWIQYDIQLDQFGSVGARGIACGCKRFLARLGSVEATRTRSIFHPPRHRIYTQCE